jgi:hypothetical protein
MQNFFYLLCASVVLLAQSATAQSAKQLLAYVVTLQGDTLRGTVQKTAEWRYQSQIQFSATTGSVKEYAPNDIRAFCIEDKLYYTARLTKIEGEEKTYFLREVVRGPVSLHEGYDGQRKPIFFLEKDTKTTAVVERYLVATLKMLLPDCPQLVFDDEAYRRRTYKYNSGSLAETIMKYNQCVTPNPPSTLMKIEEKLVFAFGAKAGLGLCFAKPDGHVVRFMNGKETESRAPGLGLSGGLLMNAGLPSSRWSFQMELLVSQRNARTTYTGRSTLTEYEGEVVYRAMHLQVPLLIKYDFNQARKGPFVLFGVQFARALSLAGANLTETGLQFAVPVISFPLEENLSVQGLGGIGWNMPLQNRKTVAFELRFEHSLQEQFYLSGFEVLGQTFVAQLMASYRW